jgi:hypothetical protein
VICGDTSGLLIESSMKGVVNNVCEVDVVWKHLIEEI